LDILRGPYSEEAKRELSQGGDQDFSCIKGTKLQVAFS
jgi:hypothetical protein